MKEAIGNLWDFYAAGHKIVITTNGMIKRNGDCVMGRGCALEAAKRFPKLPGELGFKISCAGHQRVWWWADYNLYTFPTKHNWREKADIELIARSARQLASCVPVSCDYSQKDIVVPRPGCGNGGLRWQDVKPVLDAILDDRFVSINY